MKKGKLARIAGFAGALGLSTVLVTTAVQGTGAWFTDSEAGNLTATSGSLDITTSGSTINFTGLNPGVDQNKQITYHVRSNSTTNADIWLTFDSSSAAYGKFTGAKNANYSGWYNDGGLGGYGHFKVSSGSHSFESYNLQLANTGDAETGPYYASNDNGYCNIDKYGNGGSTDKATGPNNATDAAPECGVPAFIKLASNVKPGHDGTIKMTFGLTGKATAQNTEFVNVPFKIVATQPGHRPDAANF